METETVERTAEVLTENIDAVRDLVTVKRVFGEAYQVDGVTIIPVAKLGGGGGGGGGDDEAGSSGFGSGFGVGATPVGVYLVKDGAVDWKPAVDATKLAKGAQVLAGIFAVCVALVMMRRS